MDASGDGLGRVALICLLGLVGLYLLARLALPRLPATHRPRRSDPADGLDRVRRPHEVACLADGPGVAVASALSSLLLSGRVRAVAATVRSPVQAVPDPDPDPDPDHGTGTGTDRTASAVVDALEQAVLAATAEPVELADLPTAPPVRAVTDAMVDRLTAAGLLMPRTRSNLLALIARLPTLIAHLPALIAYMPVMFGLLGGLVWVGLLLRDHDVLLLFLVLVHVPPVLVLTVGLVPRRTRRGDRALAALGIGHCPPYAPNFAVFGPVAITHQGEDGGELAPGSAEPMITRLERRRRGNRRATRVLVGVVAVLVLGAPVLDGFGRLVALTIGGGLSFIYSVSLFPSIRIDQAYRDEVLVLRAHARPPVRDEGAVRDGGAVRAGLLAVLADGRRQAARLRIVAHVSRGVVTALLVVGDLVAIRYHSTKGGLDAELLFVQAAALFFLAWLLGALDAAFGLRHRARAVTRAVQALTGELTAADTAAGAYTGRGDQDRLDLLAARTAALHRAYPGRELRT